MNLRDHNRTEEALRSAALAVSSAAGEDVFRELVRSIASDSRARDRIHRACPSRATPAR